MQIHAVPTPVWMAGHVRMTGREDSHVNAHVNMKGGCVTKVRESSAMNFYLLIKLNCDQLFWLWRMMIINLVIKWWLCVSHMCHYVYLVWELLCVLCTCMHKNEDLLFIKGICHVTTNKIVNESVWFFYLQSYCVIVVPGFKCCIYSFLKKEK